MNFVNVEDLTTNRNIMLAGVSDRVRPWDGLETSTTIDQKNCEEKCALYLIPQGFLTPDQLSKRYQDGFYDSDGNINLNIDMHCSFLDKHCGVLPSKYTSSASSKPWLYYQILNSYDLLGKEHVSIYPNAEISIDACHTCFGGYGGGYYEFPHTMTTYVAVNALLIMKSYDHIHRNELYKFFYSMKMEDGSFRVYVNGEHDCRSTYCILSICKLLNMLTPEMTKNVGDYFLKCQTYEGGFAENPGCEAHGGYTFCAVAGLSILHRLHECNIHQLEKWLYNRQCSLEGGYNGRTNKLVDGCYSWYVGSAIHIVNGYGYQDKERLKTYGLCMNQVFPNGGLRDKPEMKPDLYHTMYCLCGLSLIGETPRKIDPVHCIEESKVKDCMEYYENEICDHNELMK